jgi:sugar lactone lactonase YvrE
MITKGMYLIVSFLFGIWTGVIRAKDITIKVIAGPEFLHQNDGAQSKTSSPPQGGIWIDSSLNIYAPTSLNRGVRKFTQSRNMLSIAHSPNAHTAKSPTHVVGDNSNHVLYVNDGQQIWKHYLNLNKTDLFAGSSTSGFAGDGGPAVHSQLNHPRGMWRTSSGELLIADTDNHRIRMISSDNIITTIAGSSGKNSPTGGYSGDGGLATLAEVDSPTSVYADSLGNIYIADHGNHLIRVIDDNQIIITIAGSTTGRYYNGDGFSATLATIDPVDVKGDNDGNLYIADFLNNRIRMVDNKGIISTFLSNDDAPGSIHRPIGLWISGESSVYFLEQSLSIRQAATRRNSISALVAISSNVYMQLMAGSSAQGYGGDNGPATAALLRAVSPWISTTGAIYIPDGINHLIRRVSPGGTLTVFGGTETPGTSGTSGPIGSVTFYAPHSIVGDISETFLYISDQWYVWKYSFSPNNVAVLAQSVSQSPGFSGDSGPATSAQLFSPKGLWLTTSGVLYIADYGNHRIRTVNPSGIINTVAGSGCSSPCNGAFGGDGLQATSALLKGPCGVYMDTVGKLFIADTLNNRIRLVDANNIITTFAGTGVASPFNGEDLLATSANVGNPNSVKGDTLGNIYIADGTQCIIRVVDTTGIISTLFGNPAQCGFSSGISTRTSMINSPTGIWLTSLTTIYFGDGNSIHRSLFVSNPTSQPSMQPTRQPSGQPSREPTGQPSSEPTIQSVTSNPNLFMKLVAGTSDAGNSGNGASATSAQLTLGSPFVDTVGNVYVTDGDHHIIRKIDTSGIITAFGGTGNEAATGTSAQIGAVTFYFPYSMVGNPAVSALYISDLAYVWKYVPATGIVSVFAGSPTVGAGFSGDGGQVTSSQLYAVYGLWLTSSGILFIADSGNNRIRKVVSNTITSPVGQGCFGGGCPGSYAGDGGPANLATLNSPRGVYMDTSGRLFIADTANNRIRVVETNNIISTFAGTGSGVAPFNDGVPAVSANIKSPTDVKGDSRGNIYFTDSGTCGLRVVGTNGRISTLFGSQSVCGFSAGISSPNSPLNILQGIWVDSLSNIYFSDANSVHRSVIVSSPSSQPSGQPSDEPTSQPTRQPTTQPTTQPTRQPSSQPSSRPSIPTSQPTSSPTYPVIDYYPNLFMKLIGGSDSQALSGDNGPATSATFSGPSIPWVDTNGNLFIPETGNGRIRRIAPNGIVVTFGGTGGPFLGTGGPIATTGLGSLRCVVGNSNGTVMYISGQWYIWKFVSITNYVSIFAGAAVGTLGGGFSGDGGPASSALLSNPRGLWLTTSGVLFIADYDNNRIRKISSGIITTVAGSGPAGSSGDGGAAILASLNGPSGVYVDSIGKLFIVEQVGNRIRMVDTNSIISTLAGTGLATPYNGDNIRATLANINRPKDVKGDIFGNIYFTESNTCIIRMISKTSGNVATRFGTPNSCGFISGISHHSSTLQKPGGLWLDSSSIMYITDQHSIHRSFVVSSPTSQPSGQPTRQPTRQPLGQPSGLPTGQPSRQPTRKPSGLPTRLPSVQPTGQPTRRPSSQPSRLPSSQPTSQPSIPTGQPSSRPTVRFVDSDPNLFLELVAGNGESGSQGDNGPATSAQIAPGLLWVDSEGSIYIPEPDDSVIRKVTSDGIITKFGGSRIYSDSGSSNHIDFASFGSVFSIVGDTGGNFLYFSDNAFIWKYSFANGIVSVIIGQTPFATGFSGDGGLATFAQINEPRGLWLTTSGVLYFADTGNHRIRKVQVDSFPNTITTVAGSGCYSIGCVGGSSGDGGLALYARLSYPRGVYMDTIGRLFIADTNNNRIRVVDTNGIITTFAGSGSDGGFNGENIAARIANINYASDVKGDSFGNIYIAERNTCVVRMVNLDGIISTLFGTPEECDFTSGVAARGASLYSPMGLWVDSSLTIYISDATSIHRSLVVSSPTSQPSSSPTNQPSSLPTGPFIDYFPNLFMTLIGGTGVLGFRGDNGPASSAEFTNPAIPWVDSNGNIYIPDLNNKKIRRIDLNGIVITFGGTGSLAVTGVSGPITSVDFGLVRCIVGDSLGTVLYISAQHNIWKYSFSSNIASVVAGLSSFGDTGDNIPANIAKFNTPQGLWLTTSGDLFVADLGNHRIRMISSANFITAVAGSIGPEGFSGDCGPATSATLHSPSGVFVDTLGKLFFADRDNCRIRVVDTNNIITTFAGTGFCSPYNGDDIPATMANINLPRDVKGDTLGNIYFTESDSCIIRRVLSTGKIFTLFGTPGSCAISLGVVPHASSLKFPIGLWLDSASNLYFTDNNSIHRNLVVSSPSSQPTRQPSSQPTAFPTKQPSSSPTYSVVDYYPNLFMNLIGGTGSLGFSGDGGPSSSAEFDSPAIPWVDSIGNIYVPDVTNKRIRRIDASGIVITFGGTGNGVIVAGSGPIGSVDLGNVRCVVGDTLGTVLYISSLSYIWKYSFSTNIVSVIAGSTPGLTGDNAPANNAQLCTPRGLWLTTSGELFIADLGNNRIRKISVTSIITTVAGSSGPTGFSGDGGRATSATLGGPWGVFVDTIGKLFIAEQVNSRIRVVDSNNIITTFAGTGFASPYNGDNIAATMANINAPRDVKGDSLGNIYFTDSDSCVIRRVLSTGKIFTIFGTPGSCTAVSLGISPHTSTLQTPVGLWLDSAFNLYFTDKSSIHRNLVVSSPSSQPTQRPSSQPTGLPTLLPSCQPTRQPISRPSGQPTCQPSSRPTHPTSQPSSSPTYPVVDYYPNLFMKLIGGTGSVGYAGDYGQATLATFYNPGMPWVDSSGNVYVPDSIRRIRRIDTSGNVTTFGGIAATPNGASGPIVSTPLGIVRCVIGNSDGARLLISAQNFIWKYEFSTNIVSVYAGSLSTGTGGDNGPATLAGLNSPQGLWLTTSGDVFIADVGNRRIRKISTTGIIITVAGSLPSGGFAGDGGLATLALLSDPTGVHVDTMGKIFIADQNNNRIRVVDTYNIITTFAGTGLSSPYNGDNIPATMANIYFPRDVKGDSLGNIYFSEYYNCLIRKITVTSGLITTLFGTARQCDFSSGVVPHSSSLLQQPQGIWVDSLANLYFTDHSSIHRSMTVASPSSQPSQQPTSRPSIPTSQPSSSPSYHLIDKDPNLFMELIGGSAMFGFDGDGGPATSALFKLPGIPWVDSVGSIYIPDVNNARIRKIQNGIISTFGGNGDVIVSGLSGLIESTALGFVRCVIGNTDGTALYISSDAHIWKYVFATSIVSVLTGNGTLGFSGDGGPVSAAQVKSPFGLWITSSANIYIADSGNHRIRRILAGIITTVVGSNGPVGFSGDGGPATSATLYYPWGVFVDTMGRIFISDQVNNRIRMVNANNIISTVAGTGMLRAFNGENIRATLANIMRPRDLKGDTLGNIYLSDSTNCAIRKIGVNGNITTVFGTAGKCSVSLGVSPHTSSLLRPLGLWLDIASNLYFTSANAIHRGFLVSSPTSQPTGRPTRRPSFQPLAFPTGLPTDHPSSQPTMRPTIQPFSLPSSQPTSRPSRQPSCIPSSKPSAGPSGTPSLWPTYRPTRQPTSKPSNQPTSEPSSQPSTSPSTLPTGLPSVGPTNQPSSWPSGFPSKQPTSLPSDCPTSTPSLFPSVCPSTQPSSCPTQRPSSCPSSLPSSIPTSVPTVQPSNRPSGQPSSLPSVVPSMIPIGFPSNSPSSLPSVQPTSIPSGVPSRVPSERPTAQPTVFPSVHPTMVPSEQPTSFPTSLPTRQPSGQPSVCPTIVPSSVPSNKPTEGPSSSPSLVPSAQPSGCPSSKPSCRPSSIPSSVPSVRPSSVPTTLPSVVPTVSPSRQPSSQPSSFPSGEPTSIPTRRPLGRPSSQPITSPTTVPTSVPSVQPVANPSEQPVSDPSSQPSLQPTSFPTTSPSHYPKGQPSSSPSNQPTSEPTRRNPLLTNATFAADGQSVLVNFAMQCTTPKLNEDFACDKFFHFPCANVSTCHWVNGKTLQALVPSDDDCARPGDIFQISDKADNPLCSCTPAKDCSKLDISLRETLIESPKVPAVPSALFNLPSVLPSCSGLNLDLSSSIGDSGRSWSRVNVTVTSGSISYHVTDLQRIISSHFNVQFPLLSPPLQISSNFLKANTELNFTAEICNFLGGCNSNHFTMKVVEGFIPTATIVKAMSSDMTRVQSLLLLSAIQKTSCNTSLNVNDLQYIWTVFRLSKTVPGTKVLESTIRSSSKDPSRFALNPYSLQSNQSYVINLLTKYLNSSSVASVQIDVKIGNLRAIIQGNNQQAMRVGEVQNLDGSQSYDEDKENFKGFAAGLKFSWSCSSSGAASGSACSNLFNATLFQASRQSPVLIFKANQSATNQIASLTLTVSDLLTKRTATTTITMNILPSMYPTVALSSNAISTSSNNNNKMNPSQSLQLTANINIPTAGMNGNITWFSTNVDLHAISITSLRQPVSSTTVNSNLRFYFALLPNALTAGKLYSFGLKCQLNGNIQTTSFISIAVNAPPSLGSFVVSPLVGSAYLETFHLTCNRWIDSDLPLSYQFSYLSQTSLTLITKSVTPLSYAATVLPEGLNENSKKVGCQADIYDSLNANSTVYTAVQVNSLFKANLSALVHFNIDVKNAVDLDDLIKGVNIASSLLNQPNCTLAPNCTQLNRFPCLSNSHTCGSCQISYFASSTGDGNELCVKQLSDRVITHQRRKECYLNCSSHGDCIYYSQVTGKKIDSCYEGDLSCYSSCSCDVGYKLSNYCEMTDEESKTWISLRDLVVSRIITNVQLQDPSEQVVSGWMNSLLAISQVPNQISEKSLSSLLDLSQHALSVVGSNGFSASTALANYLSGMDSLSAVLSILGNIEGRGRRRRLEETNSYNQQISGSLKNYSLLISQSMVPGQSPLRIMKSNFKLHIQNLPLEVKASGIKNRKLSAASTTCSSTTEVSLPQTLLEKGLKQAPTVLTIPTCAENQSSLQISAFSLSSKLFNNDEFTSNALSLSFSSHPCSSNNMKEGCNAEFSMESHNSGTGLIFATENRTVKCVANDFTNHTVPCPNHKNYSVPCHGKTERIIFQCPSVSLLPSCQGLIGNGVTNDVHCERKSFGKENITCVCPLSPSSVSHSSSSSATTDISIVALLTSVETTFVSTLLSADDLTATSLAKSWEAIVTVGVFLATIIGFMCFSVYADDQVHKKVSIEEKMMDHAKVHSVYRQKLLIQSRKDNSNNQEIDLFKMAEEALPGILSCPSLNQRIWNEEKKFHRWLGIIYYFSTVFPRILRVVSLASNIIIMLFIQSLTYNYTHGDDGSCELLTTEETCMVPRSSYGTGGSKCYWSGVTDFSSSSIVGSCEFIQPENSIEVMLFVAIFSGLVSAPLAICVDWIIHNFLSAPNGSSSVDVFPSSQQMKEKKELAILPVTVDDEINNSVLFSSSKNRDSYQIEAEKDYQRLRNELFFYRGTIIDEEHRSEIDRLWALSGENQRIYWDDDNNGNRNALTNRSGDGWILQRLGGLVSRSVVATQSISKSLLQELIQLYDNLEKESIKFKLLKTEKDQSKRLLYLFQKDLVPGITGEILEAKEQRENIVLQPVSMKIKFLAWFFLGVLDLGMLFYVFLFALSQDSHRQAAWGRSLGIYLFLDIVLISTLMVIFMHVLLPSLIMRDVGKIKKKVTESIHEFYEKMDQEKEKKEKEKEKQVREQKKGDSDSEENDSFDGKEDHYDDSDYDPLHLTKRKRNRNNRSPKNENKKQEPDETKNNKKKDNAFFNAAKYLFLSYRMAEQYPALKASQIILQYSSPWPKQDYKHIKDMKSNYSDKYSGITRAISIIVIFFLTNLLATPLAIQDMILQICTTAAIGYTMLIHIQLYYIYPALVIIPTLAVIALAFVVKRYWKDDDKEEKNTAEKEVVLQPAVATNSSELVIATRSASVSVVLPPPMTITTRRQSLQYGLQLASELKNKMMSQEEEEKESEDKEEESESEEEEEEEEEKLPDERNDYQDHDQKKENDKEEESEPESLHEKHKQNQDFHDHEQEIEEEEKEESESEEFHADHHQNHDHDQHSEGEEELSSESHSHSHSHSHSSEEKEDNEEDDTEDDEDLEDLFSDSSASSDYHNHTNHQSFTRNGQNEGGNHDHSDDDDISAQVRRQNNNVFNSPSLVLPSVAAGNYDFSSYQTNADNDDENKAENEEDEGKLQIPGEPLSNSPAITTTVVMPTAILPSQMILNDYYDENDDDDFVLSSLESSQNGEEDEK